MRTASFLIVAFALILSACGGDSDSAGVASLDTTTTTAAGAPTTAPEQVDQEEAAIALVACLRDQGLEVDDPTVDAEGNVQFPPPDPNNPIEQDELEAALENCQEELQAVVVGFTANFDFTQLQDTLLEYAECVRANGFDLPDPDFSNLDFGGDEPPSGPFGDVDFNDPDFIAANEECDDILSGLGFGG